MKLFWRLFVVLSPRRKKRKKGEKIWKEWGRRGSSEGGI